jgi:polyferredoxin
VCPTGIDIRDGLQNECIACAACIDACDQVMVKMNYPRGLIRYSSATGMQERLSARQMILQVWRPRVWMYGALMLLVASLLIVGLSARKGVAVDVIKDRGALAREQGNGDIENIYLLKVMNAAEHASTYRVSVQGLPGMTLVTPAALDVPATGIGSLTVRLALGAQAAQAYRGRAIPITFKVQRADTDREVAIEEKSTFVIPR